MRHGQAAEDSQLPQDPLASFPQTYKCAWEKKTKTAELWATPRINRSDYIREAWYYKAIISIFVAPTFVDHETGRPNVFILKISWVMNLL